MSCRGTAVTHANDGDVIYKHSSTTFVASSGGGGSTGGSMTVKTCEGGVTCFGDDIPTEMFDYSKFRVVLCDPFVMVNFDITIKQDFDRMHQGVGQFKADIPQPNDTNLVIPLGYYASGQVIYGFPPSFSIFGGLSVGEYLCLENVTGQTLPSGTRLVGAVTYISTPVRPSTPTYNNNPAGPRIDFQ
jgi:hypothetical protein